MDKKFNELKNFEGKENNSKLSSLLTDKKHYIRNSLGLVTNTYVIGTELKTVLLALPVLTSLNAPIIVSGGVIILSSINIYYYGRGIVKKQPAPRHAHVLTGVSVVTCGAGKITKGGLMTFGSRIKGRFSKKPASLPPES